MTDILHLYGNWKWTGPTELAVHLAESQTKAGHRVRIAFGRQRGEDSHFTVQCDRRGLTRVSGFELPKHLEPWWLWRDARALARLVETDPPEVIHCHLQSDHLVATFARKFTKKRVPIVRSTYEPFGPLDTRRERYNLRNATERLLLACEGAKEFVRRAGAIDLSKTRLVEPAIDTVRFDRNRSVPDAREKLKIPRDAFVLGIVARVQARRRFDVFLEAARRLCTRDERAIVVILGGGTHQYEVARKPAEDMGLGNRILFPGVLRADEYVAALRCFDVKCYMTPGTDGTCRAVKEAMCSGIPVAVARTGMLPDIVKHEQTGFLFDSPADVTKAADALDAVIMKLHNDAALRARIGAAAAAEAHARWRRELMRERVDAVYKELPAAGAVRT